ncbi:hypothetical protein BH09BAC1_BH09BAC1_24480 [soil metagenome]
MKVNKSINALFVAFCVLLLGFVYINTKLMDEFALKRSTETPVKAAPVNPDLKNNSEKILK